jgi:hypothetical protein
MRGLWFGFGWSTGGRIGFLGGVGQESGDAGPGSGSTGAPAGGLDVS